MKEAPLTGRDGIGAGGGGGGGGESRCVSLLSARPRICGCCRLKRGGGDAGPRHAQEWR